MRVTVLHLDLGIGGAERLVVNACVAALDLGHSVALLTSHHSPLHCFEETRPGGRLAPHIRVHFDWLPRQLGGGLTAFFSALRMALLALRVVAEHLLRPGSDEHVVFIDGVSAPVPLLKFAGLTVVFYCHFPDKLLVQDHGGPLKRMYRYVMDGVEESSSGCADLVLVNSTFTAHEFRSAFPLLGVRLLPLVLHPSVEADLLRADYLERRRARSFQGVEYAQAAFVFVSLNRFERAKRVELAIQALALLKTRIASNYKGRVVAVRLVVAGGFDPQVRENAEYLEELRALVLQLGVQEQVVFRTSIGAEERTALFACATALVYTPGREHFGIAPIEAMALGLPVIACASGGPLETINQGATGFLCVQNATEFANNMMRFVIDAGLSQRMAEGCRRHVDAHFSSSVFRDKLGAYLRRAVEARNGERALYYTRKCAYVIAALLVVLLLVVLRAGHTARKLRDFDYAALWRHITTV